MQQPVRYFVSIIFLGLFFYSSVVAGENVSTALKAGGSFTELELQHADGSNWSLSDYAGQPKLVMFWATWCPYCRKLFPAIVSFHKEYADQGLEVVAVNFRDDGDTVAYAKKHGIDFDVLVQGDALAAKIGVKGTPTVFVLDRQNRVILRSSNSDPHDPALKQAVLKTLER